MDDVSYARHVYNSANCRCVPTDDPHVEEVRYPRYTTALIADVCKNMISMWNVSEVNITVPIADVSQ